MSRQCAFGLRLVIAALVIIAALWGALWSNVEYQVHRARFMLAELSRIQVGDTEASVLPLVRRYAGSKWTPEPLPPRDQWLDKDEYDYQTGHEIDYKYRLGLDTFGGPVAVPINGWTEAFGSAREHVPVSLRPLLGLRGWGIEVDISIRRGHVQSVSVETLVEGRSQWVGHSWELADRMPRSHMPSRAYAIGSAHLTTRDGGGEIITNFFTPAASKEEVEAARIFNVECLTSLRGCGICDVAPRALEYLECHPDAAWNIIPPKCP